MAKAAAKAIAAGLTGVLALAAAGRQEGAQTPNQPASTPRAAPAPTGPICTAQIEGQLACQGNRLCECVRANAVPARDLPARWRWDCSIKRPRCTVTPESLAPQDARGPYPTEVEIDRGGDDGDDDAGADSDG